MEHYAGIDVFIGTLRAWRSLPARHKTGAARAKGLAAFTRQKRAVAVQHLTEAKPIFFQFGQTPILARVETALAEVRAMGTDYFRLPAARRETTRFCSRQESYNSWQSRAVGWRRFLIIEIRSVGAHTFELSKSPRPRARLILRPLRQVRQLGDVGGDPPRLVAGQQVRSSATARLVLGSLRGMERR